MRIGFHSNLGMYLKHPTPAVGAIQVFLGRPISFTPSEPKDIEYVKDRIKELDLKVYVHSPYVFSLKHKTKSWGGINQLQTIMKNIGFEYMVVHCRGEYTVDEWVDFIDETIDPRMILLENMANGAFKTLEELEEISERTGCGICIDTAHLWNSGDETQIKDWKHVKLVHCNVANGEFGGKVDKHSALSLSEGNVDWVQYRVLSHVDCDIITEVSAVVGYEKEIQLITKLLETNYDNKKTV